MPKFQDITGLRVGRLTILGKGTRSGHHQRWRCICDCGNRKEIFADRLRNGTTRSCGCIHADVCRERRLARDAESLIDYIEFELNSGCWLWAGATTKRGYGVFTNGKGALRYAHRTMHELINGPIGPTAQILHSCDTPPCCNPAHLRAGTPKANSEDMVKRGRSARGERAANARLTEGDVRSIRQDPRTQQVIADAYGVALMTINHVKNRRTWRHVE